MARTEREKALHELAEVASILISGLDALDRALGAGPAREIVDDMVATKARFLDVIARLRRT